MKISIIVATFNSEKTIERCLESIKNQNYLDYEVVVQDGHSSDKTMEIVKKYEDARYNVVSEVDTGIYDAFNKAVKRATGDYVLFLNSDDQFYSNSVLHKLNSILKSNDAISVFGNISIISTENRFRRDWNSKDFSPSKVRYGYLPPHPGCLLRRHEMKCIGEFDENLKIAGDTDYLVRFFMKYPVKAFHADFYITKMYSGGASTNGIMSELTKIWEDFLVYRRYTKLFFLAILVKKLSKFRQIQRKTAAP